MLNSDLEIDECVELRPLIKKYTYLVLVTLSHVVVYTLV